MKMLLFLLGTLLVFNTNAQLSSPDIRHSIGKGPYPIYLTAQTILTSSKHLFRDFTDAYSNKFDANDRTMLHGFEFNLGGTINDKHLLGIKNLYINGILFEGGYRYLFRNFQSQNIPDTTRFLHVQEEVVSLRMGYRLPLMYPFTFQIQAGPTIYNFYLVRETITISNGTTTISNFRERGGSGLFERIPANRKLFSGWDIRGRLMLFDPAGTAGGVGAFFEYRFLFTNKNENMPRDLSNLYDIILQEEIADENRWNYGTFTFGLVVPFALRIIGLQ